MIINNHALRKQRRKLTIVLSLVYVVFGSIFVFAGHKLPSFLSTISFLIPFFSIFIASTFWIKWETRTKWQEAKLTIKTLLFAAPFILLLFLAKYEYGQFHLSHYRKLTTGIVSSTFSQYNSRGATTSYYATVLFPAGNSVKQGTCWMKPGQYQQGDIVIMAYSYKDTDFYELLGLKRK